MLNPLLRDDDGLVYVPEAPGLGVEIDTKLVHRLTVPLKIDTGVEHASALPGGGSVLYDATLVLARL